MMSVWITGGFASEGLVSYGARVPELWKYPSVKDLRIEFPSKLWPLRKIMENQHQVSRNWTPEYYSKGTICSEIPIDAPWMVNNLVSGKVELWWHGMNHIVDFWSGSRELKPEQLMLQCQTNTLEGSSFSQILNFWRKMRVERSRVSCMSYTMIPSNTWIYQICIWMYRWKVNKWPNMRIPEKLPFQPNSLPFNPQERWADIG